MWNSPVPSLCSCVPVKWFLLLLTALVPTFTFLLIPIFKIFMHLHKWPQVVPEGFRVVERVVKHWNILPGKWWSHYPWKSSTKPVDSALWGHGLVVNMVVVIGWWLDMMILTIFSSLNFRILYICITLPRKLSRTHSTFHKLNLFKISHLFSFIWKTS